MRLLRALAIAFSTCSRIPMPRVELEGSTKLTMAVWPLVGVPIGLALWVIRALCRGLNLSAVLYAALAVAAPVAITGGIHLDGYCDVSDALASHRDREEKLKILKDPNIGAFAAIRLCVHLLCLAAVFFELYLRGYDAGLGWLFFLSRCFAALYALTMPSANKNGLLAAFAGEGDKKAAYAVLAVLTVIGGIGWALRTRSGGLAILLWLPVTMRHRRMAAKNFGGVTGDITGHYLQVTELTLLAGLLIGGLIMDLFGI